MAQPESAPPSRPPPPLASRDLSEAEFAELAGLLAAIPEPLAPLAIDTADGFLAALAVQPVPIEPAAWLRFVFDVDGHRWGEAEPSAEQRRAGELLQRRLAAIEGELAEYGGYAPYLLDAPADGAGAPEAAGLDPVGAPITAVVAPWLEGFFLAVDRWPLADDAGDDRIAQALARLERYLVEPLAEPPAGIDAAVDDALAAMLVLREQAERTRFHVATVRREAAKVGRNEPCPCGSGRKFKQCHGGSA